MRARYDFDYVVVGSGFGGSVAALRLSQKGYRVLVLEKGKWFHADDMPKTNWNLRRWLWLPALRCFGLFKITFFRHIGVTSGVGVGGGSLVYAAALQVPKAQFFHAPTWAYLADWQDELCAYYDLAAQMLGAAPSPCLQIGDVALRRLAEDLDQEQAFELTRTGIYFGQPGEVVRDPYFGGRGPDRAGCTFCGGCMVGCRYNAKNSLDKNYLYLAQREGAEIRAEAEVVDIRPLDGADGAGGYRIAYRSTTGWRKSNASLTCRGVVLAAGVLGTVKLLLDLQASSLPRLSPQVGAHVRTNSESLIGVTTLDKETVFSDGVAIGCILQTDEHSHLEPVRYPAGSGFWRMMTGPMVAGGGPVARVARLVADWIRHPWQNLRVALVDDWAKRTQILLYMRAIESTLRLTKGRWHMKTTMEAGERPTAFVPDAKRLADHYARLVNGKPTVLLTESVLGIPTTAHILGGAVMGRDPTEGVIDEYNRVFGYRNMFICDGSTISANPGVNPALTIVAISERAMSFIGPADESAWAAQTDHRKRSRIEPRPAPVAW